MQEYGFPQLGYDDITEEQVFVSAGRTVTESDVVQFAGLTGDMNELHTNEQYAAGTPFGTRIVHGMLTLAIANGLYMRMNVFEKNTVANLGIETWSFRKPVFFGDTLRVRLSLAGKRLTSKPGRGIVRWQVAVLNQKDETVADGIWVKMFRTSAAGSAE